MFHQPAAHREDNPVEGLSFTVHIFREGEMLVAYVPELDLSSCGKDPDEARRNIRDAVQGYLETSRDLGSLENLTEAGYRREGNQWRPPEFVALDRLNLTLS